MEILVVHWTGISAKLHQVWLKCIRLESTQLSWLFSWFQWLLHPFSPACLLFSSPIHLPVPRIVIAMLFSWHEQGFRTAFIHRDFKGWMKVGSQRVKNKNIFVNILCTSHWFCVHRWGSRRLPPHPSCNRTVSTVFRLCSIQVFTL